jgi:hypothetical protein
MRGGGSRAGSTRPNPTALLVLPVETDVAHEAEGARTLGSLGSLGSITSGRVGLAAVLSYLIWKRAERSPP